jgi:hypothetical protein
MFAAMRKMAAVSNKNLLVFAPSQVLLDNTDNNYSVDRTDHKGTAIYDPKSG